MPLNAHVMVQKVAREIAATVWEDVYARDNRLYNAMLANYGTEKRARLVFIKQVAPKFYEQARSALVDVLAQPDEQVPISVKNEIAEALILDNACRGNRQVAPELVRVPEYLN